ncbi:MAG: L-fuculose kinase [Rhodocyclaceae bacterium]|nr:MAG: L-fuculose kinase [Rhodocyclaceae bacterium]
MSQLDLAGMGLWLHAALRDLPEKSRISAIVPVGHGAACVLLDADGQVVAAPDYEDPCFAEIAAEYQRERDPFSETLSPRLPDGQNLGAQLFFVETRRPAAFARTAHILLLPQYWAWHLCGIMASEVTSLGAHSDLWQPLAGDYSRLARRRGWSERFPPRRAAGDVLGLVDPEVAAATGLPGTCQVACGIHDSNASWLWHSRKVAAGRRLTVISSGTWTIAMQSRADLDRLREARDMLANVDAFGQPVATARFMGGREYAAITAGRAIAKPGLDDLRRVVARGAMALPAFADAGGPFHGQTGRTVGAEGLSDAECVAMATAYLALVTEVMLDLLGDTDTIVVDGPFGDNPLFAPLLKTLRPSASVFVSGMASGPNAGAMALVLGEATPAAAIANRPVQAVEIHGWSNYRATWRAHCVAW